jgi:hypothetical protein
VFETHSANGQRQVGFWSRLGKVAGSHDAARRNFGPVAAQYTNLADQDTANWGSKTGTATVTTGKAAPDGTTGAAELSSASGDRFRAVASSSQTCVVGDWIVAGVWVRAATASVGLTAIPAIASLVHGDARLTFESATSQVSLRRSHLTHGDWVWLFSADKVRIVGSNPDTIRLDLYCDASTPQEFYAPMVFRIPSGVADSEAWEAMANMSPWPDTAAAGQVAMLRDQNFQIPRGYVEIGEIAAPGAPSTNYVRLYADESGGKTRLMARFATGAVQQVAIEP